MNPLLQQALAAHQKGLFAEAERLCAQALALEPANPVALHYFGFLRLQKGRFAEAVGSFDKALALDPKMLDALGDRALALCNLGRFAEALGAYDRALALKSDDPRLIAARAGVLATMGRYAEALAGYDRAMALEPPTGPSGAGRLHRRGMVLIQMSRFDEALFSVDRCLVIAPNYIVGLHDRSLILRSLGRSEEALATLERVTQLQPDYAEAWNDRGICLHWDFSRTREALASFERCLQLQPNHPGAHSNRGVALWSLGRIDEAEAAFGRALALDPDSTSALYSRGYMIWERRRLYEPAIADLERLMTLDPGYGLARGNLFYMKAYGADWAGFDRQARLIDEGVRAGLLVAVPFVYQAISSDPADLQTCARLYTADHHRAAPAVFTRKDRRPGRIRLGYVCGEFREQATMYLTAGLYEAHDRTRFEVLAFDNGHDDLSPLRKRIEGAFDKLIPVRSMGDPEAARCVAAHDIDVLINLNGYFGETRMDVFARRSAPVQVTYLGFPGTLGAPYMDYIIADRVVLPEEERRFYDEQVVYLPHSYQANDDRRRTPAPATDRAAHGLPDDAFVFCHFNAGYKLTPQTFARWMGILKRVPDGVLWLLEGFGPFADNLRREAAGQGVAPERLVFAPMLDQQAHLARLPLGDLFLDSLPYNAHTTAADALWMGLPLITLRGKAFAGRVASSLLTAIGLPELIVESVDDYEALAVALAGDPARLSAVRAKLAANKASAPLFDTARYARHLEQAYEIMLERWARGEAPAGFSVFE